MARGKNNQHLWRSLALAFSTFLGCGFGNQIYHTSNLPPELMVARSENARTVDLSKLATYSINSDIINRGDVLEVSISTGYGNEKVEVMPVRVDDEGNANVPILGHVPLAGLELLAAEHAIAAAGIERGIYRNPSVTVTMKKRRMNKITVVGAVEKPGVYELPRADSTLLAAIVAAQGLTKQAGTNVEIRSANRAPNGSPLQPTQDRVTGRTHQLTGYAPPSPNADTPPAAQGQLVSYRVDLVAAAKQGNGGQPLADGDVVMVERRDPQPVHVIGLVFRPGQYELPVNQDLHVLDVIALAGGLNNRMATKIHVIRRIPGSEKPSRIELNLNEAKRTGKDNLRLAPGDVVSIEDTPTTMFFDALRTIAHVGFSAPIPSF